MAHFPSGVNSSTVINYTYVHDDNGNLTSKSDGTNTWSYTWDDENRLTAVVENSTTLATYEYDSNSRLLQRTADGTTTNYTWDGWDLIKEEKTGTVTETIRYAVPQGGVQSFVKDGDRYYLHGDGLSSSQLVTDSDGNVASRIIYGAWGEELHTIDSVPNGLDTRFVGGLGVRNDSATRLIYMRYRWYDPTLQRFISRDPIGLKGGSNLYAYAANQPVDQNDVDGFYPKGSAKHCSDLAEKLANTRKDIVDAINEMNSNTRLPYDTCGGPYNVQGPATGRIRDTVMGHLAKLDFLYDTYQKQVAEWYRYCGPNPPDWTFNAVPVLKPQFLKNDLTVPAVLRLPQPWWDPISRRPNTIPPMDVNAKKNADSSWTHLIWLIPLLTFPESAPVTAPRAIPAVLKLAI